LIKSAQKELRQSGPGEDLFRSFFGAFPAIGENVVRVWIAKRARLTRGSGRVVSAPALWQLAMARRSRAALRQAQDRQDPRGVMIVRKATSRNFPELPVLAGRLSGQPSAVSDQPEVGAAVSG